MIERYQSFSSDSSDFNENRFKCFMIISVLLAGVIILIISFL